MFAVQSKPIPHACAGIGIGWWQKCYWTSMYCLAHLAYHLYARPKYQRKITGGRGAELATPMYIYVYNFIQHSF
jgi:hypothetical protein